jgi:hypothetical protein
MNDSNNGFESHKHTQGSREKRSEKISHRFNIPGRKSLEQEQFSFSKKILCTWAF